MAALIGALRVTLGANTAAFEAGMRRAQAVTTSTVGRIRSSLAGLGAGAVLSGAGLLTAGTQALRFAANLGETAQQVGVTVEQLQILSRIALQSGASQENLERSLSILNRTLGQAKAGGEQASRAFRALGITREQLNSWQQGGDALRTVAERITRMEGAAQQAAAANLVFGRSGAQLLPTLHEIANGYDRAAEEAQRMGLLTAEQVAAADRAADEFDLMANVLRTRLAIAMAESTTNLRQLTRDLSDILGALNTAGQATTSFGDVIDDLSSRLIVAAGAFNPLIGQLLGFEHHLMRVQGRAAGWTLAGLVPASAGNGRPWWQQAAGGMRPSLGGPTQLNLARPTRGGGGGGGGGGRDDAERRREQAMRDEHDFQSRLRQYRMDLLRATQERAADSVTSAQLDQQILDLEREQFIAERSLAVALGEETQAKATELTNAYDRVRLEREAVISLRQQRDTDEEAREIAAARGEVLLRVLEDEVDLADTAEERRAAELRLLDATYQLERARLSELATAEGIDEIERQRAVIARDALDGQYGRDRARVMRDNRGPLGDFLAELPTTAARAREALESVAADGLDAITDGLADAILMTRSWGSVFRDVANQILRDLLRISIQRAIAGLIGNALGGGGGGTAAIAAKGASAGASFGGFRAAGGPVLPGRTYVVGERGPELLHMGGRGNITPNGAGRPIEVIIRPTEYFDAVVDQRAGVVVAQAYPGMKADTIQTIRRQDRRRA